MFKKVNTPVHHNSPHNHELDGHQVQGESVPGHNLYFGNVECTTTSIRNNIHT